MKSKRTQLSFNINAELRQQIKIVAAKRNISMNLWLMRAIYIALKKEVRECEEPTGVYTVGYLEGSDARE